jgi:hypothetical protein
VPSRPEQYRLKAKECAVRADATHDSESKRQFEEMACQWRDLANYAEKNGG